MNLNHLRFVKALSETHSFSRAAEACFVTQPALSNAVAQLERELGGPLFERTTRKVVLTTFGQHLLPLVEDVLNARSELQRSAEIFFNPDHKLVRIGMSPLVDMRMLTLTLEPFCRDHPDVELIFKECFLNDLDSRLGNEQVDFGIRPNWTDRAAHKGYIRNPFYDEPLYFIPPSVQPSTTTTATSIQLNEITNETYVLTPDVCGLTSTVQALFDEQGFRLKKYPGQALSYEVLQEWAALGIGAAILPRSKISPSNCKSASVLLLAPGREATVRHEVIWNRNGAHSTHVAACREYIQNVVPEIVAGLTA